MDPAGTLGRAVGGRAESNLEEDTQEPGPASLHYRPQSGERLLRAMSKKGAQLLARGLYVKHVLEQLKTGSKRDLITLIVCLFAGLQANVMIPVTHGQAPSARMAMKVEEDSGLRFDLANSRSRSTGSTRNSGEVGAAPCR